MYLDGGQVDHLQDDFGRDGYTRFVVAPRFDGDADQSSKRDVPRLAETI
jgi:hypothetical protein